MRPDRLLYKDFPLEIRRFYGDVAQARDARDQHAGLLEFIELTLFHLASVALSDYRSRCPEPDAKVESMIDRDRTRNLVLRRVLELFRICAEALPDPLIPPPQSFPGSEVPMLSRFVAAVEALKVAVAGQRPGFRAAEIDVAFHVDRQLAGEIRPLGWWAGWGRLVEYRNKVVHSGQSRWPTRGDGFWETMTPSFTTRSSIC